MPDEDANWFTDEDPNRPGYNLFGDRMREVEVPVTVDDMHLKKKDIASFNIDANGYQRWAMETAIYPGMGEPHGLMYAALGMGGECGEAQEVVKKLFRNEGGIMDDVAREKLAKELGDVMWYVAAVASEAGLTLGEIMGGNLRKIDRRKFNDTIKGEGGDR